MVAKNTKRGEKRKAEHGAQRIRIERHNARQRAFDDAIKPSRPVRGHFLDVMRRRSSAVIVSDTTVETTMAKVSVSENSRNSRPDNAVHEDQRG